VIDFTILNYFSTCKSFSLFNRLVFDTVHCVCGLTLCRCIIIVSVTHATHVTAMTLVLTVGRVTSQRDNVTAAVVLSAVGVTSVPAGLPR